jgi:hypothetical protein
MFLTLLLTCWHCPLTFYSLYSNYRKIATMRISQSQTLLVAANTIGTIFIGFGINGMLRPEKALELFEFEPPVLAADKKVLNALMIVESARNIFIGLAIYSAAFFGNRKALGCTVSAAGVVAFVDGAVCWHMVGKGEWNHWGYAPLLIATGSILLGILDKA